jgi:prepilin-type N-terminal cleavage/methylation domain-containing protein
MHLDDRLRIHLRSDLSPRPPSLVGGAAGFTLVEFIIVVVILGVISTMAYPLIAGARASASLRAARVQFASSLATARAAAVRWGRPAQLKRTGNSIQVRADTSGTGVFVALSPPVALDTQFGVTLSATVDSIVFGPRGLATNLSSSGARFALVRGSIRDSVCLTRLGESAPRGCR